MFATPYILIGGDRRSCRAVTHHVSSNLGRKSSLPDAVKSGKMVVRWAGYQICVYHRRTYQQHWKVVAGVLDDNPVGVGVAACNMCIESARKGGDRAGK